MLFACYCNLVLSSGFSKFWASSCEELEKIDDYIMMIKHRHMLLLDYVVAFAAPFTVGAFLHVLYPCFAQKDNG